MKKERTIGMDPNDKQNRISQGTKFVGEISSQGGFRIDGELEGKLTTSGKVVVGSSGLIKGTLICKDADIEGTFNGTLNVSDLLSLKSTALIEGDVTIGKLAVEPGARFNASCVMKGAVKRMDDKNARQETQKPA